MISRNKLIGILAEILIVAYIAYTIYSFYAIIHANTEIKPMFPEILGDTVLRSNATGISTTDGIREYDNFRGDVVQGYEANYSGINETMIIFIAQMKDNESANGSLMDMVKRDGYNESISFNQSILSNTPVVKLPVQNPQIFLMQKSQKIPWHYAYAKKDKVYWIGFSKPGPQYQISMLYEVYRGVDSET
jgi:hypothetical protein